MFGSTHTFCPSAAARVVPGSRESADHDLVTVLPN